MVKYFRKNSLSFSFSVKSGNCCYIDEHIWTIMVKRSTVVFIIKFFPVMNKVWRVVLIQIWMEISESFRRHIGIFISIQIDRWLNAGEERCIGAFLYNLNFSVWITNVSSFLSTNQLPNVTSKNRFSWFFQFQLTFFSEVKHVVDTYTP